MKSIQTETESNAREMESLDYFPNQQAMIWRNLDKPRMTFQDLHFKRGSERVSQKSTCDLKISGKQSPNCIALHLMKIKLNAVHFGEQLKNHSNTSYTFINDLQPLMKFSIAKLACRNFLWQN